MAGINARPVGDTERYSGWRPLLRLHCWSRQLVWWTGDVVGFHIPDDVGGQQTMCALRSRPGIVKQIRAVLRCLLVFAVVCIFTGCEGQTGPKAATSLPPPEVVVAEVVQQDVPIYSEWIGTTEGYVNAQI